MNTQIHDRLLRVRWVIDGIPVEWLRRREVLPDWPFED
jgi:hypothetical protein